MLNKYGLLKIKKFKLKFYKVIHFNKHKINHKLTGYEVYIVDMLITLWITLLKSVNYC